MNENKKRLWLINSPGIFSGIKIMLWVSLLLLSCGKQETPQQKSSFTGSLAEDLLGQKVRLSEYVVAFPATRLGSQARIELEFSRPMVPSHLVNVELSNSPISFTPNLEGKAVWISTSLLRFYPSQLLKGGSNYRGILKGKLAFGEGADADDFPFAFAVAPQELLESSHDFLPDGSALNRAQLEVILRFAYPVDSAVLHKGISLQRAGKRHPWQLRSQDPNTWVVLGGSVERGSQAVPFALQLDGNFTVEGKDWIMEPVLPPAGEFIVVAHGESQNTQSQERIWMIRFSDPVATDRDISGFVSVSPAVEYKVSVRGKSLYLKGAFVPGTFYNIKLESGLPSAFGPRLARVWTENIRIQFQKPRMEWLGSGVLVPVENRHRLQFRTMNLTRIHLRVREILPQNLGFFLQNNVLRDATRKNSDEENFEYFYGGNGYTDVERVAKVLLEKKYEIPTPTIDQWHSTELDLSPLWSARPGSGFLVDLQFTKDDLPQGACTEDENESWFGSEGSWFDNPCSPGYYYRHGSSQRFLITSSLTAIAKSTRDGVHLWVTDVAQARPVAGLRLELFSFVNEVLATATTDRDGHVFFATNEGAWVRGSNARGMLLLKLNHRPWEISRFDVGGADPGQGGLRLFAWTERGVHRPGDTIHLSGIFRDGANPPKAPGQLQLVLRNPHGQEVLEENVPVNADGMFTRSLSTALQDPTGTWSVLLRLGGREFHHPLKIETVRPNRLKVDLQLPAHLQLKDLPKQLHLQARYLFGAPAKALQSEIQMYLSPLSMKFLRYPEFRFSHPEAFFAPMFHEIYNNQLDNQGSTTFQLQLPTFRGVPEALSMRLQTRVHERGGSYTEHWSQSKILPYPVWVGVGIAMDERWGRVGDTLRVPVVVLDSSGRAVAGRRVRVRWYSNNRLRWFETRQDGEKQFRTAKNTVLLGEIVVTSAAKPVEIPVFLAEEGMMLVEASDIGGGHESGITFFSSPWGAGGVSAKRDPEAFHLELTLNRNRLEVGDSLRVTFPAVPGSRALVTLEQGHRLLRRQWVDINANMGMASFRMDSTMVPNVHVVVALLQPHKRANDQPLRLYGIVPAVVEDASSRLDLKMSVPREVRPGEEFSIRVRAGKNRGASYVIAVVDEGLLDLTGFRTPNPWNFFHRSLALGINTRDNMEEVVDALLPAMDGLFRVGGDESSQDDRRGNPRARRFVPVSLFTGIRNIRAGKEDVVTLRMPQYVGSVRVMLVGASGRAVVSRDTTIAVRQPLMILPTAPRLARPGDQFELPVSVFAMDKGVRKVRVSVRTSNGLKLLGDLSKEIEFSEPGEKDLQFTVEVMPQTGVGEIIVQARGGTHTVEETIKLPIQSANPLYTEVVDTMALAGTELLFRPDSFGIAGTNRAKLVLSHSPVLQVDRRMTELVQYPYGCLEQIVSAAFAQLYLDGLLDLTPLQKVRVTENIKSVLDRLPAYLARDGGFYYWPVGNFSGQMQVDLWSTIYTAHFIQEASRMGYHVPQNLLQSWQRFAKKQVSKVQENNHRFQTYLLYVLAKYKTPEMGAMNLLRENHLGNMDVLSRRLLAASFALSGQRKQALQIESQGGHTMPAFREMAGTFGSDFRDRALMALVALDLENPMQAAREYKQLIEDFRGSSWLSTQENAMALLALSAHKRANVSSGSVMVRVEGIPGVETVQTTDKPLVLDLQKSWGQAVRLQAQNATLYVVMHIEGVPLEQRVQTSNSGLLLIRQFFDGQGMPMQLTQIQQGQPFWVGYRVRSTTGQRLQGLALSSLFPAGWEIVNPRMGGEQPPWVQQFNRHLADYMDIRDDRINWFLDLPAHGEASFLIQVHPSFAGSYSLPPVVVEAMYSPEFFARIAGGRIQVQ